MLTSFPGQVYANVKTQAAMTFALVLLVLLSLFFIGLVVRVVDGG